MIAHLKFLDTLHIVMLWLYSIVFHRKRAYEVKGDNLEGKYKDWQKKLHPDLVHTKSEVVALINFRNKLTIFLLN